MKLFFLSLFLCFFALAGTAQNQPEQNCVDGIAVCQAGYTQTNTYLGAGTVVELNSTNQGCLASGELNCVWYIIQVSVSGQLALSITPSNLSNDYDFAVWNISANGCQDIYNGGVPIACNFSGLTGATGLSGTITGAQWNSTIPVTAGQTLALNISNFSQLNQSGYVLDFSASTASIFDNLPPRFSAAAAPCNLISDSVDVTLSEAVKCAFIAANGSDFSLLSGSPTTVVPPTTTIVSATSVNCTGTSGFTRTVRIKFSAPLSAGYYLLKPQSSTSGTYLQDACGNSIVTGPNADSIAFVMTAPIARVYVDSAAAVGGTGVSWASPLKTVTQALALANAGCLNEIWVAKGTYYPMLNPTTVAASSDSSFRISRNGIKMYGGFAGTETTLSARNIAANPTRLSGNLGANGNSYHVVTVVSSNTIDTSTRLDGFIVRDGYASDSGKFTVGGKIIRRSNGGGMYTRSSSPTIANCAFLNNKVSSNLTGFGTSNNGGGVYNDSANLSVVNCVFSGNQCANSGFGVGMFNNASSPAITNCTFSFNTSPPNSGFGIGMGNNNAAPKIVNCVFASNSGGSAGGAIYNKASSPSITNGLFVNNNGGSGGAIYDSASSPAVTNCTFYANTSVNGGALYNRSSSVPSVTNCIVWGNTASGGGTDFYNLVGAGVGTSNPTINYTHTQTLQSGTGNSIANPVFTDSANAIGPDGLWRTADDGLRLLPCSPSINTGSNAAIPAGITTDIRDTVRIQNIIVDRGAYEMFYNSLGGSVTTIAMSPANPVCSNSSVTFTATTTTPGTAPVYHWKKNGANVGTNTTTYTASSWVTGDSVWVVHTNNDCGVDDSSAKIVLQVKAGPAIPVGPVITCAGSTGNVYSVPAVSGVTTYTWTVPTGWAITAGQGTPSVTVTASAGNTTGNIVVNIGSGCPNAAAAFAVSSSSITPSLAVVSNAGSSICAGTLVTFTAMPTNGGTAPTYQWKKNGTNVGTSGPAYSTSTLATGDVITATLTSNAACLAVPTAVASAAPITVVANVVPVVSIAGGTGVTLCVGFANTFVATAGNGGPAPVYHWYKNGVAIAGATGSSYTGSSFANNDSVYVVLTSNATCRTVDTVRSSAVSVTVFPYGAPTLIVGSNSGNTICQGTPVIFTATPLNGGTAPGYQWKKNGTNVGSNSATYSDNTLATGDAITITLTSNSPCAVPATVTASGPPITVVPNVTPTLSINGPAAITLCAGAIATFTTSSTAGGPVPTYQWYRNGVAIAGQTAFTYTGFGFADGDSVWVVFKPTAACRLLDSVRSNSVKLTVNPNVVPVLTVTANPGTSVPAGTAITFTATVTATGTTPVYQWFRNGVAIAGAASSTYTTNVLVGGDLITVGVSNLGTCATPNSLVSAPLRISGPAGIQAVGNGKGNWKESILLHPNPNRGRFTVSADWGIIAAGERVQVTIVNALGQQVFREDVLLKEAQWNLGIHLSEGVANGLYMLRLQRQSDGSSATMPVLIQR